MTRRYAYAVLIAAVVSTAADANCDGKEDPVYQSAIMTPGNYEVKKLFEIEGSSVYRFKDDEADGDGKVHYFMLTATGRPAEVTASTNCGKNCETDDTVMVPLR